MKFRKKPVVIEATQWFKNGDHPQDNSCPISPSNPDLSEGEVVRYFCRPDIPGDQLCRKCGGEDEYDVPMSYHGWIDTLEGGHIVCPGDFIITGVQGERYPCKPDIFEATYEFANAEDDPNLDSSDDDPRYWVTALALELPEPVFKDVAARITSLYAKLDAMMEPCTDPDEPPNLGCDLAPAGWWCSREPGHEGPCAAREIERKPYVKPAVMESLGVYPADYVQRLHSLVASMVENLKREPAQSLTTFDRAWLSTFDNPDLFPEVTKIVEGDMPYLCPAEVTKAAEDDKS
jgi:hypothetical protein